MRSHPIKKGKKSFKKTKRLMYNINNKMKINKDNLPPLHPNQIKSNQHTIQCKFISIKDISGRWV